MKLSKTSILGIVIVTLPLLFGAQCITSRVTENIRDACIPNCVGTEDILEFVIETGALSRQTGSNLSDTNIILTGFLSSVCNPTAAATCSNVISQTIFFDDIQPSGLGTITQDMRTTCIPACVGVDDLIRFMINITEFLKLTGTTLSETELVLNAVGFGCGDCARVVSQTVFLNN